MAFLNVNTPLKNLKTGDYFYPLTNLDQIITGSNRLSAFMSEDNNLLNLSNIGNLSVNNINVNNLTVSGNTTLNNGLTVSGNTTLNNGNFYFNSDTGTYKFYITRDGSAAESTGIWVNDSYTYFDVLNDETTANIQFKLQATDTESGGGAGAQTSYVNFYGRNGKSTINANCFGVNGDNSSYNLYINGSTLHNGVLYFANGTSYFINNSAVGYLADFRADRTRLVSNWLEFYASANAGGNRYGYIQTDSSKMYFRKENDNNGFDFNGTLTTSNKGSSWIAGQNNANKPALNLNNATDTGSYWPWMRQTNTGSSKYFSFGILNTGFYWIGSATSRTANGYDYGMTFNVANGYLQGCSRVYAAVWNDYAEFRKGQLDNNLRPGQIVAEIGDGSMKLANKKLQKGCKIISDTYGFAIGETEDCKLPIAVSGRVLIYCDTPKEELEPGDCLCSNYTGNAIKMTQEEIIQYPDRIVATVSEIPSYKYWKGGSGQNLTPQEEIEVNGRIWVYVK